MNDNCAICGKEYHLGCEVEAVCKEHLTSLKQLYQQGWNDAVCKMKESMAAQKKDSTQKEEGRG